MLVGTDGAGSDRIRRLDRSLLNNRRTTGVGGGPGMIASGLATICQRIISRIPAKPREKNFLENSPILRPLTLRCARAAPVRADRKIRDPPPVCNGRREACPRTGLAHHPLSQVLPSDGPQRPPP